MSYTLSCETSRSLRVAVLILILIVLDRAQPVAYDILLLIAYFHCARPYERRRSFVDM